MAETVTLRNEYGARLRGGPAGIEADPGEEVEVTTEHATYYTEEYGFVVVGERAEPDTGPDASSATKQPDLDGLDYRELQALASEYDDIAGNQAAADLRTALRTRLED